MIRTRTFPFRFLGLVLFLFALLLFQGCFSPFKGDEAVISVDVGKSKSAGAVNAALAGGITLEEGDIPHLVHTITVSGGPGPEQRKENVKEGETVTFLVTPGLWNISVHAFFETDGENHLIARGQKSADITNGRNNVSLDMEENETIGGTGTLLDPFLVYSRSTLLRVGRNNNNDGWLHDKHYKLISDITLPAAAPDWIPIATMTMFGFTGSFDGGGHTISGLKSEAAAHYLGMFDIIGDDGIEGGGIVKNLRLKNVVMKSIRVNTGAIAGAVAKGGVIQDCVVEGTIESTEMSVGGVAGKNNGRIIHSSFKGTVKGDYGAGGIAGWSADPDATGVDGVIQDCVVEASVSGKTYIGGIAGTNGVNTKIENCTFRGSSVTATEEYSGGIAAENYGGILNSKVQGRVSGAKNVGGITGINHAGGNIQNNCTVSGTVSGTSTTSQYIGGIAGTNSATISECKLLPAGKVSAVQSNPGALEFPQYVGGIAGENSGSAGRIERCTVRGRVESAGRITGGIAGRNSSTYAEIQAQAIYLCVVSAEVVGRDWAGGIAGENLGIVSRCYTEGKVMADSSVGNAAGGIAAVNVNSASRIRDCYTRSYVEALNNTGGIVGSNDNGIVEDCYALGEIKGGAYTGGITGNNTGTGTVSSCAALNPKIQGAASGTVTYYGRVAGAGAGLSNNHARVDMVSVNPVGFPAAEAGAGNKGGQDVSPGSANTEYNSEWFWLNPASLDWDGTIWTWDANADAGDSDPAKGLPRLIGLPSL